MHAHTSTLSQWFCAPHPLLNCAGSMLAIYAQLCRTMGVSPFGTMRLHTHRQVLAMAGTCGGGEERGEVRG